MASEDSRYRDRCLRFIVSVMSDPAQALSGQMEIVSHHRDHLAEGHEVVLLGSSQRVFLEERDDQIRQI